MTITVRVNGTAHTLPAGATVAQLVQQLGHAPNQIATAVNGDFVARAKRSAQVLLDGDRVHCFQPIGGG